MVLSPTTCPTLSTSARLPLLSFFSLACHPRSLLVGDNTDQGQLLSFFSLACNLCPWSVLSPTICPTLSTFCHLPLLSSLSLTCLPRSLLVGDNTDQGQLLSFFSLACNLCPWSVLSPTILAHGRCYHRPLKRNNTPSQMLCKLPMVGVVTDHLNSITLPSQMLCIMGNKAPIVYVQFVISC